MRELIQINQYIENDVFDILSNIIVIFIISFLISKYINLKYTNTKTQIMQKKNQQDDNSTEKQSSINKVIQLINELNDYDIQYILEECIQHVLIPNWYTKDDLEKLTNTSISNNLWNKIITNTDIIDESNTMCLQWFNSNYNNEQDLQENKIKE